jgi:hypothetical protein
LSNLSLLRLRHHQTQTLRSLSLVLKLKINRPSLLPSLSLPRLAPELIFSTELAIYRLKCCLSSSSWQALTIELINCLLDRIDQLLLTLCANNEANAGSISALLFTNGTALFSFFTLSSSVRLAIALLVIVCDKINHWLKKAAKNYGAGTCPG